MIEGHVRLVESQQRGAVIVGWSGDHMEVASVAALPRDGGTLLLEDGQTTVSYTEVIEGPTEDDPDVLVATTMAPPDWGDDEVWAQLTPEAVDVVASVATETGEIMAAVPHALRPLLVDGVREEGAGETVRIQRVDMEWQVADVLGRRAQLPMESLAPEVVQAIESAGGGVEMIHTDHAPDRDGVSVGDTWFRHGDAGVVAQWHWDGTAWASDTLTGAVLANIDAGSITSGDIQGLDIYSPSKLSAPRMHIGGAQLEIIRPRIGADGTVLGEQTTTVLGGAAADQLQFYDADNNVRGGFDADGVMTSQSVLTNSVSIAGTDIVDIAQRAPQGMLAAHNFTENTQTVTSTAEKGIVDLQFIATPGRTYKFSLNAAVSIAQNTRAVIAFRTLMAANGEQTLDTQPTVANATQVGGQGVFPAYQYVGNTSANTQYSQLWQTPASITQPTACRVLLSYYGQGTGSIDVKIARGTGYFCVEDIGSTYTGIFADGNFGAPVIKTVEDLYYAGVNSATWTDGSLEVRPGDHGRFMSQGQAWDRDGNWGGGHQTYTNIWIPQGLIEDMQGAQSIAWIAMGISPMNVCWPEGFVPRLARSAAPWNSGSPSSSVPSASGEFDAARIPAGGTSWINLPAAWYPDIKSGALTSVQLGTRVGADHKYAGQFGYYGLIGGETGKWPLCPFKMRYTK